MRTIQWGEWERPKKDPKYRIRRGRDLTEWLRYVMTPITRMPHQGKKECAKRV